MRLPRLSKKPLAFTGRNRRIALRLLTDVLDWFERNEIEYALDAGTLLGAVRDNDLIPWDDDIDLCIPQRELPKLEQALADLRSPAIWISKRFWEIDFPGVSGKDLRAIKIYNPPAHAVQGAHRDRRLYQVPQRRLLLLAIARPALPRARAVIWMS